MDTRSTLTLGLALGLTLVAGAARADGPSAGYGAQEVGTVRYINRAQSLVVLDNGTELRAPDPRMLSNIAEGELVKVDFTNDGVRSILNFIEPAGSDDATGASPNTDQPGPHFHG
jgi:hypothetical protein